MARQAQMVAQLPPTPCTQEMRDQVVDFADREGVSIAEVQRQALSLFFTLSDRESIVQSKNSYIQPRQEQKT